jgi:hypothetical protein
LVVVFLAPFHERTGCIEELHVAGGARVAGLELVVAQLSGQARFGFGMRGRGGKVGQLP